MAKEKGPGLSQGPSYLVRSMNAARKLRSRGFAANCTRRWSGKLRLRGAADNLQFTSRSPIGALGAIAESAARLLDVAGAEISRVEGDGLNCACDLRGRGGRCSDRSYRARSLLLEPIDGLSDTSKLHIWLGPRALDPVETTPSGAN
jgi:hypothetical protein